MLLEKAFKANLLYIALLVPMLVLTACRSEDELLSDGATPEIVFLFSPGGLGDMSYNDRILEGIQHFKKEHRDVDAYIYSPNTLDEAERIFADWLARPESTVPVLFVLSSSDYEPMAERHLAGCRLTANKSILLFESRKHYDDEKIHTFQI